MADEKIEEVRKKAKTLAEKAPQGSCIETNKKLVKELEAEDIEAELTRLPKQNHTVTTVTLDQEYIIDPLLTKDYGVGSGKVLFTKEEHTKLIKEVANKQPFKAYMDDKEVIYKKVKEEEAD